MASLFEWLVLFPASYLSKYDTDFFDFVLDIGENYYFLFKIEVNYSISTTQFIGKFVLNS